MSRELFLLRLLKINFFVCYKSIKELDVEVIKGRENYDALGETLKSLKKQLSEKNTYIDELNSNYALVNTERNCYKKMVEDFDQYKTGTTDSSKQLEKRCQEYEMIISQLKKGRGGELNEIQLCNNTSIQFEEVSSNKDTAMSDFFQGQMFRQGTCQPESLDVLLKTGPR